MCVCLSTLCNNLKPIADICLQLGGYVDSGKVSDEFACQDHRTGSRSFSEGLRSLGKVGSYSVWGSEIPSVMSTCTDLLTNGKTNTITNTYHDVSENSTRLAVARGR